MPSSHTESSSEEEEEAMEEEDAGMETTTVKEKAAKPKVYLPGTELQEGEELVRDSSTYYMYHVVRY